MNWFINCIRFNYVNFEGRARRKEYWMYTLCQWCIYFICGLLYPITNLGSILLGIVVVLLLCLPTIAVTVRRLHDTNRSGWWYLILFIPYIGPIVILVFMCLDSTPGENKHGKNPKNI